MGTMVRRTKRRSGTKRNADTTRLPSFGAHWRDDGTPKTGYRSEREALAMADERHRETGADLSVYRCDFCFAWHMGNAGGRRER